MSQFTEEEIDRIIDNCERIAQDAGESIDEVESLPKIVEVKHIKKSQSVIQTRSINEEQPDTDEYFESFFQKTKEKKTNKHVKYIN